MLDQLLFSSSNAAFSQVKFNNYILVHKIAMNQPNFTQFHWLVQLFIKTSFMFALVDEHLQM